MLAPLALRVVNCALADTAEDDPVPLVNAGEGICAGEVLSPATISDFFASLSARRSFNAE